MHDIPFCGPTALCIRARSKSIYFEDNNHKKYLSPSSSPTNHRGFYRYSKRIHSISCVSLKHTICGHILYLTHIYETRPASQTRPECLTYVNNVFRVCVCVPCENAYIFKFNMTGAVSYQLYVYKHYVLLIRNTRATMLLFFEFYKTHA